MGEVQQLPQYQNKERGVAYHLCHSDESVLEFVLYCGNLCGDKRDYANNMDEDMTGPTVPAGMMKQDKKLVETANLRCRNRSTPNGLMGSPPFSPYASRAAVVDPDCLFQEQLLAAVRPEQNSCDDLISCDSSISSAGKSLHDLGRVRVTFDSVLSSIPFRSDKRDKVQTKYMPPERTSHIRDYHFSESKIDGVDESKAMEFFEEDIPRKDYGKRQQVQQLQRHKDAMGASDHRGSSRRLQSSVRQSRYATENLTGGEEKAREPFSGAIMGVMGGMSPQSNRKKTVKVPPNDNLQGEGTVARKMMRKNSPDSDDSGGNLKRDQPRKKLVVRVKERKEGYEVRPTDFSHLKTNLEKENVQEEKTMDELRDLIHRKDAKRSKEQNRSQSPSPFQLQEKKEGIEFKSSKAVFHMKDRSDRNKSRHNDLQTKKSDHDQHYQTNREGENDLSYHPVSRQDRKWDWTSDDRTHGSEGCAPHLLSRPSPRSSPSRGRKKMNEGANMKAQHDDDEGVVPRSGGGMEVLDRHRFDKRVLGTSVDDESAKPHVMSTAIMDNLQEYLPYCKRGENFWLKYSLIRDGANMHTLLHKTRGSQYTILAVETVDGEVFGAFTGQPWHVTWNYFGTPESFLWRLRRRRGEKTRFHRNGGEKGSRSGESDLSVYEFAGHNQFIQFCNKDRIAVGAGSPMDDAQSIGSESIRAKLTDWGFGLAFNSDLQQGTSSPCATFQNPPLSTIHSDGSRFDVLNLEVWTLTPCMNVEDAVKMEMGKLMIDRNCTTV